MKKADRLACPKCQAPMILALQLGGKGPRTLQCLDCDRPDPLKSDKVTGWLNGELGSQTRTSNPEGRTEIDLSGRTT
jgi:hypothetical protein